MTINTMSKEFNALFNCLQLTGNKNKEYQCTEIYQELTNWNQFVKLVRWHKVTPIVYNVLNEHYRTYTPKEVLSALKLHCNNNTMRVMKLTSELIRLGKLFQEEDIPFISFKGPFLSQRIYGDVTLREPKDLDLLIHEDHLLIAHKLLLSQGYQLYLPRSYPSSLHLYTRYQKDFSYFHPSKQIILELHWRFFNNQYEFIYPTKQLFQIAERESFSGVSFAKMPIELELIYLLYHGTTHLWSRLCWLHDIKQYLSYMDSPNWCHLFDSAKKIGAERPFLTGLTLTNQLFHVTLDPIINKNVHQNKAVQSLIQQSYLILMQSQFPTRLMRLRMLPSRFQLRELSLPYSKAFFVRLLLRLFQVIRPN